MECSIDRLGDKNSKDKEFFLFDGNNWRLSFRPRWDENTSFVLLIRQWQNVDNSNYLWKELSYRENWMIISLLLC